MTLDNRPKTRVWLSAILLVVFAVYASSIANEFAHDDRHYAMVPSDRGQPNELVAEWQGFGRYFSSFYGEGAVDGATYDGEATGVRTHVKKSLKLS